MASLWRGEGMLHWRVFQPHYPPLAVEVGHGCLHFAYLERTKDKEKKLILRRYGRVDLPEGALRTLFGEPNVLQPAEVGRALLNTLERESIEARESPSSCRPPGAYVAASHGRAAGSQGRKC